MCATNKTAEEMLSLLKGRINRSRDEELHQAALEQQKISKIRMEAFVMKQLSCHVLDTKRKARSFSLVFKFSYLASTTKCVSRRPPPIKMVAPSSQN
ncbi:hypothetical protein P4S64_18025 [Vibrio sp. M60_M31a]